VVYFSVLPSGEVCIRGEAVRYITFCLT